MRIPITHAKAPFCFQECHMEKKLQSEDTGRNRNEGRVRLLRLLELSVKIDFKSFT